MSGSAPTVVVVGSLNVDQVVTVERHPAPGETVIASSLTLLPGGKGANQAVAAARRGAATTMVGLVGDDDAARVATSLLASSGVDVSRIGVVDAPTGLATVTVDAAGENTIVVVPGANGSMTGEAVDRFAPLLADAAVVVLQGEIPASGLTAAARHATGRVVLNLAPVIDLDPRVVRRADPLVVNEHEAALVLARLSPGTLAPTDEEELARALLAQSVTSVVITRGARGAVVAAARGTTCLASPHVVAVDTSGAGDAFVGALSASLAAGDSLLDAASHAVRVGAFAVQGSGTQPSYPTLDDVLPGFGEAPESTVTEDEG